ncbi:MAG: outer membrane-specific lipoprotein transporter subunit LolC [Candidatus Accumulibacter regalis]|mgnify:FL=1|jgi:putative ABC transport system permease protein|uniref:Outer membrane-specific lipoprotein transporter subunit LolC n=1 Tax=Accumulibacter regalis TaxID=522306 RepID=A0A011QEG6_ACCRE|nr:ABC transporter permease [Accumulibacter sp.]EXI87737.1 MAG: outer membrane-specific lipoprotein transporter subunit LolC [Candidatus Accumulibacter regalis]MBE2258439.1 ABC transporter permease [Paracoccaceae bacterium]HRE71980.1 ABC transporter permease [Accumulibacter sp.]
MRAVLLLALKSAWARRLTLGIALVAIALASALLLAVERVRSDARASFTQSVSGVDLVVGARSGAVQLMLYAVFHSGSATNNMRWESFEALATHPAVDWAVPLSLGDGHRGFPVLGTSAAYFDRLRYGDRQALTFSAGKPFAEVFEAVLGSEVAAQLGYRPGDHITLSHGMAELGPEHADKPFTVVGILAPTGTPVDRTVHVDLAAITAIHLDWAGGAPLPGLAIPAEQVRKFDLQPQEITAMLIGLKSRGDVFRLQRHINGYRGEPLLAVMPGVALDELWQTLATVEQTLFALSALVVAVGLAGLTATLLAGLNERRRELAILRALGAGPREIFMMLTVEGLLVTALGVFLGAALLAAGIVTLGPLLREYGVHLALRPPAANEWGLVVSILTTGLLASLVPGWRAWQISLADGLTPRN